MLGTEEPHAQPGSSLFLPKTIHFGGGMNGLGVDIIGTEEPHAQPGSSLFLPKMIQFGLAE